MSHSYTTQEFQLAQLYLLTHLSRNQFPPTSLFTRFTAQSYHSHSCTLRSRSKNNVRRSSCLLLWADTRCPPSNGSRSCRNPRNRYTSSATSPPLRWWRTCNHVTRCRAGNSWPQERNGCNPWQSGLGRGRHNGRKRDLEPAVGCSPGSVSWKLWLPSDRSPWCCISGLKEPHHLCLIHIQVHSNEVRSLCHRTASLKLVYSLVSVRMMDWLISS